MFVPRHKQNSHAPRLNETKITGLIRPAQMTRRFLAYILLLYLVVVAAFLVPEPSDISLTSTPWLIKLQICPQ